MSSQRYSREFKDQAVRQVFDPLMHEHAEQLTNPSKDDRDLN